MTKIWRVVALALLTVPPAWAAEPGAARHSHGGHAELDQHAPPAAATSAPVSRTITVTLDDTMRFDPPEIRVRAGETIRFRLINAGGVPHEMVLGSDAALAAHAQAMRGDGHGAGHGADHPAGADDSVGRLVAPGQRATLVRTFNEPGVVDFACLLPGHREAGMSGRIFVQ